MLFYLGLQHMCSLESEFESQMGEFHVKMKGKLQPLPLCVFLLISFFFSLPHFESFQAWLVSHVCVQATSMR